MNKALMNISNVNKSNLMQSVTKSIFYDRRNHQSKVTDYESLDMLLWPGMCHHMKFHNSFFCVLLTVKITILETIAGRNATEGPYNSSMMRLVIKDPEI